MTHFSDDLEFDEGEYRKHLAWLEQFPVGGLFAAGGTGEGFSLTLEETDKVVRTAVEEVGGAVPVLAPATGWTKNAVAQAKAAKTAGADGNSADAALPHRGRPGRAIAVPTAPGLGIELDRDRLAEANALHLEHGLGARDDATAMQFLVPDWTLDPKRPCLAR